MSRIEPNIFEPSGCLTRDAFYALAKGNLPAGLESAAKEHLLQCPFCSDAMEGYGLIDEPGKMTEIMAPLDKKFLKKNSDNKRTLWLSISAAATVLLLVGLFFFLNKPKEALQIAEVTGKKDASNTLYSRQVEVPEAPSAKSEQKLEPTPKVDKRKSTVKYAIPEIADENRKELEPEVVKVERESLKAVSADKPIEEPALSKSITLGAAKNELAEDDKNAAQSMAPVQPVERKRAELQSKKYDTNMAVGVSTQNADIAYEEVASVPKEKPEVLSFVEEMPEYPGGPEAMMKFLHGNLKVSGDLDISCTRTVVTFMVDENGKISTIKILRGECKNLNDELIRVIKLMPPFKPGKQNGKPVKVWFNLPININLQQQ